MKVICAGFMKTGTKSMAKALRILGYKTYDVPEHVTLHAEHWSKVFLQKKQPDFLSMYSEVDAVVDLPANAFYKEILETFPDAKVILTERDSEDVWVESMLKQIDQFRQLNDCFSMATLRALSPTVKKQNNLVQLGFSFLVGTGIHDKGSSFLLRKKYREHNEQVKASVPSDQLLVFNVKQGWGPLCEFLGCNIPSCPFPRENVKGSFVAERVNVKSVVSAANGRKILKEVMMHISLIVLLVGIILVMFKIV